jgi:predicted 3-demethylubiquinone-9 3-methyltransferase (glyoxalase superfamily)
VCAKRAAFISASLGLRRDHHGHLQTFCQPVHIDDVEAGDRDSLQEHRSNVPAKLALFDQRDHPRRRVGSVSPDWPRNHAVEPRPRANGPEDADVAAMSVSERRVVEPDDVGDGRHEGSLSQRIYCGRRCLRRWDHGRIPCGCRGRQDAAHRNRPIQTGESAMQKITPFLWFDGKAEEAMNFYVAIIPNSKVIGVTRVGDAGPGPKGSVLTTNFVLNGVEFVALNGGPQFKFTEALSFVINCETQEEVDRYWEKLSEGGHKSDCGWLKDKYGLSWQITPIQLPQMLKDKDPKKADRVMKAMMRMQKLDIQELKQAYEGKQ